MYKATAIIIFFLRVHFCFGQSYTIINYSEPEGLPSSEVYEIYQDKNKFLWFATDNGVTRFDGYEMRTFSVEQGLSDPVIFGFHEDKKGRIWFRSFSGKLSYYDPALDKIIKYRYNSKLTVLCNNSFLWSIQVDSLDQLWFGVDSGWGKIDSLGKVTRNSEPLTSDIYLQKVNNDYLYGRIANAGRHHKKIFIDDKYLPYDYKRTSITNPVICTIQWKNKTYFSSSANLYQYNGKEINLVWSNQKNITNLSKDQEDNLWIGYIDGVERFSDGDFKNSLRLPFFNDKTVTEVLQDHEKGLWISTVGKGVFYIPNFNVKNQLLSTSSAILNASILNNQVLVSTKNGLMLLNKESYKVEKEKLLPKVVKHIVDHQKQVWVVTRTVTLILDSTLTKVLEDSLLRSYQHCHEDSKGNMWTINRSVVKAYRIKDQQCIVNKELGFIYRSLTTDDSLIYLTARTGLHVYDRNLNLIKDLKQLSDYKISKVIFLNDSTLLLTTIGDGFFTLDKRTWKEIHFNLKNKFIASHIYTAIITDSTLWLGTEKGIIKIGVKSLMKQMPASQVLTKKTGLIADKTNLLLDVDKNIWAIFDNKFSVFPKNINLPAEGPLFYIKSFLVNNQPKSIDDEVKFGHDQNNITINFGFIAFSNQNIFVRYKLRQEDHWIYTKERSLGFYSLSPEDYNFEMEYSIDNMRWRSAMTPFHFVINPPWWRTWYFQLSVAALAVIIISLYFASRVFIYRRHQQKLVQFEIEAIEHERSRIAKDLHDSVGTDFSAIKMMVSQLLHKHPKSAEVETQFQNTLYEIKNIIYGLSPPGLERYGLITGLNNYIEKLSSTTSIPITLNTFGDEIKDPKISIAIFRIVQELISNSLKHSNATAIALHINSFDNLLNIVYEDNGKGFKWDGGNRGLGLYNIESRIQSLNGQLRFDSGTYGVSYTIDIELKKTTTRST